MIQPTGLKKRFKEAGKFTLAICRDLSKKTKAHYWVECMTNPDPLQQLAWTLTQLQAK